eukprot:4737457-Prymnesium_polylepis.1
METSLKRQRQEGELQSEAEAVTVGVASEEVTGGHGIEEFAAGAGSGVFSPCLGGGRIRGINPPNLNTPSSRREWILLLGMSSVVVGLTEATIPTRVSSVTVRGSATRLRSPT